MKKTIIVIILFLGIILGVFQTNAQSKMDVIVVNSTITINEDTNYNNTEFKRGAGFVGTMFHIKDGSTLNMEDCEIDSDASIQTTSDLFKVEGTMSIKNVTINNFSTSAYAIIKIGTAYNTTNGSVNIDGLNINNANSTFAGTIIDRENLNDPSLVTIDNLNFSNSTFGMVARNTKNISLTNSTIQNNQLEYIFRDNMPLTSLVMENNVFDSNQFSKGTGLYFNENATNLVFNNITFTNNNFMITTTAIRGVIFFTNKNQLTEINLEKLIFNNNKINTNGKAALEAQLASKNQMITISNSEFNDNVTASGLVNISTGKSLLIDNEFNNNKLNLNNSGNGVLKINNGESTIQNSKFINNSGINISYAAALHIVNATVNIDSATFDKNQALDYESTGDTSDGGAINAILNSTVNISNSSFTNNFAVYGGAIAIQGGTFTIESSNFDNNEADWYGGAIFVEMAGDDTDTAAKINNTNITNNTALYAGGGVYLTTGDNVYLDVTKSTFENNTVTNPYDYGSESFENEPYATGGGLFLGSETNTTINEVDFINNSTTGWGGGMALMSGHLNIIKANFEKNHAGIYGGGLYNNNGTEVTLYDVLMDYNTSNKYGGSLFACPGGAIDIELNNSLAMFNDSALLAGDSVYLKESSLKIAKYSLGLGKTFVYDDKEGARYQTGDSPLGYQFTNSNEYLKLMMSDYQVAKDRANIIFTNNSAGVGGGALGSNGHTIFGDDGSINIEVEKVWDDDNNINNKRPDNIGIVLKGNDTSMEVAALTNNNNYHYTFSELPKSTEEYPIVYTIAEDNVPNYEISKLEREEIKDANGEITGYKFIIENKFKNSENEKISPQAPTLDKNVKCEKDYKLVIPKQEGIEYLITWNGKKATIVAIAKEGYVIADGATTEWVLNVKNPEKCETSPQKPNPEKPNPEKPNPDKPNPNKPNPDKPNPDKPNPNKPNPDKPGFENQGLESGFPSTGSELLLDGLSLVILVFVGWLGLARVLKP